MKPNVLWISLESFRFPLNETADEKYKLLSEGFNQYLIGISLRNRFERKKVYDAHFYLIPRIGRLIFVFPIYLLLLFFIVPYIMFRKRIDVVVCSDPFIPGFIGAMWKRLLFWKKIGLVIEAFGNWTETPAAPLPKILRWPVRIMIKMCSFFSISAADALRAESKVTLRKLKSYTKRELINDHFPLVHMELFEKTQVDVNKKHNEYRILFIGRIVKLKGVQYLIEILNQVKEKHPETRLIVVGDGEYLKELKYLVRKLDIEDKVDFLGSLSRNEVKEALVNCDLFVLPSMSEGLPRVVIEAMIVGKPVIATKVGAVPELIHDGKNGWLISPYDMNTLKEKIIYCLENKKKVKEMGMKENKNILESFGDRFTIKGWYRLYSKLLMNTYNSKFVQNN